MRVAIIGAGGVGAYYGGLLARAGTAVHLFARVGCHDAWARAAAGTGVALATLALGDRSSVLPPATITVKTGSLLLLRVSLGLLMLIWGVDKLVNVQHGLEVSQYFYLGAFNSAALLRAFGVVQMALGVLIVLGLARRVAYPLLLAVTGVTLLGVWKSVVDPWGWYLEGSNVLFYPSLIVFAASLVLWSFRDDDRLVAGPRAATRPAGR